MDKQQVIELENKYYMPVFNRLPIVLDRGEGCFVYDNEGKKYLDFLAGIAVNAIGHGNKKLVAAISEQAAKMIHCSNLFYTEQSAVLVKKLAEISGFDRAFLCNSGAEANEGALKLARKYAYKNGKSKPRIIAAMHSFHGRTITTLTATGQPKYQEGYDPLPKGFEYVDFGDLEQLEKVMGEDVCAVLLEPVQGEGGVHPAPKDYLAGVRKLCDKHSALLILDEIQTGIGRTGKWFAFEHYGVRPDIVTVAKGLGGGFPVGAFLSTEKISQAFNKGDHGTTFGGNPLACAAANATLGVIEDEKLLANTEKMGSYFQAELGKLQAKYPTRISTVRGLGLLLGMELNEEGAKVVADCLAKGLIINCTAGKVLRFVPSLIVNKEEIDMAIKTLDEVLAAS